MGEIKFEDALEKLEKIVEVLEKGDLPLEKVLERYEEGIRLSRICSKKLETAQKKVEILVKSTEGKLKKRPFNEAEVKEDNG